MPVRIMLMDAMNYDRQLRALKRTHRDEKDLEQGDEYLSGISKADRIKPVFTVTLYYGKKMWDGALDLYGLLDFEGVPKEAGSLIENYKINLVDVRRFPDWELFQTDLKEIFGFIRYSEDQEKLRKYLEMNREKFSDMEEDAFDFLTEVAGMRKNQKMKRTLIEKGGKLDMCKAIMDMMQASRREGMREGMNKGIKRGKKQGMRKGIEQGKRDYLRSVVKKKLEKGQTEKEIAAALEEEAATIRKVIRELCDPDRGFYLTSPK